MVRVILVNTNLEAPLTKARDELAAAKLRLDKFVEAHLSSAVHAGKPGNEATDVV